MSVPQFKVGTKFINKHTKRKDIETIVDIYITTNIKGDVIRTSYVATHDFMGSTVTNYDVCASTISRGIINN